MKKLLVFLMGILSFGVVANAAKYDISNYTTLTGAEVMADEGITYKDEDYTNSKDGITIYMFRGKGCGYCKKFLNFVNDTLNPEYGDMFNIVTFEVWYDSDNSDLMNAVASVYGDEANGVPYIIIGDTTFGGYAENMNESIINAVKILYDTPKDERVDMFDKLNGKKIKRSVNKKANTILLVGSLLIVVCAVVLYTTSSKKYKEDDEDEEEAVEEKTTKKVTVKKTTTKKAPAKKKTTTKKKSTNKK